MTLFSCTDGGRRGHNLNRYVLAGTPSVAMLNYTIPSVYGALPSFPCTAEQGNIVAAHLAALVAVCAKPNRAAPFLLLEADAGTVHSDPISIVPTLPHDWCVVNVCPTNTAEPGVYTRQAHSPYDFGAVAIMYNPSCICRHVRRLAAISQRSCEPYDSIVYRLPGSFRTGVMWIEHVYGPSSHSDGWAHGEHGKGLVATARAYWNAKHNATTVTR
jgi:hypothetical protein